MRIKKPGVSLREIASIRRDITKLSRDIEDCFIYLGTNLGIYSDSYLFHEREKLGPLLRKVEDLDSEYKSCFWFMRQSHPNYESAKTKINLLNKSISEELSMRLQEKFRYSR
jgi:hypothetical protein